MFRLRPVTRFGDDTDNLSMVCNREEKQYHFMTLINMKLLIIQLQLISKIKNFILHFFRGLVFEYRIIHKCFVEFTDSYRLVVTNVELST